MSSRLFLYYEVPLKRLISMESKKDIKYIRQNYGQLGVDIFQKEKNRLYLQKKSSKKAIINFTK